MLGKFTILNGTRAGEKLGRIVYFWGMMAGMVAVLAFGTPPGVVLSPLDPSLLGAATADLPITAAYAVASLDPVLRPATPQPQEHGTVEALAIAPAAEADMRLVEVAHALQGRGLDGDRYAAHAGTFSPRTGQRPGYDLTLIAADVLDELDGAGSPIDFTATRRNVLTEASTLTPSSAAPSSSAMSSAVAAAAVSPALTSNASAAPATYVPSYTEAAYEPTSSPTARSRPEHLRPTPGG